MTKMTLGLQNHWRMANSGVGIMPRDLTLAEIRSNTLLGRRRGWQAVLHTFIHSHFIIMIIGADHYNYRTLIT